MRQIGIILLVLPVILNSQTTDQGSGSPMMVIEMKPGDTHLDRTEGTVEGRLGCWMRLDAASVSTRYRHVAIFWAPLPPATSSTNWQSAARSAWTRISELPSTLGSSPVTASPGVGTMPAQERLLRSPISTSNNSFLE